MQVMQRIVYGPCRVNLGDKGMDALVTLGAGDMRRTLNILQVRLLSTPPCFAALSIVK